MGNRQLPREILTTFPPAFLLDLDGTLYTDTGALPGAVEVVSALRRRGVPFRFVSNTTGRSRARVAERLRGYGFVVTPEELITSIVAAGEVLRGMGASSIAPFVRRAAFEDLDGFELRGGLAGGPAGRPDAVLVGDLGEEWSHALLNEAFRYLLDGVPLVALEKDRYWLGPTGLELDAGPYVVALEYAAGVKATVCGKPSQAFYHTALGSLGVSAGRRVGGPENRRVGESAGRRVGGPAGRDSGAPAMVGDDLWSDVDGAQRAGLQGWLVRTGKFRPDVLAKSGVKPDRVLDSIADLMP
ncbi:MAG: HAD-IIA family hydrolase [Gemmatimonadetes bacterium]|nr:HAD-IIA family hydrolase [Gemmatimonadota bacterium]